jgi:hypothetical protein
MASVTYVQNIEVKQVQGMKRSMSNLKDYCDAISEQAIVAPTKRRKERIGHQTPSMQTFLHGVVPSQGINSKMHCSSCGIFLCAGFSEHRRMVDYSFCSNCIKKAWGDEVLSSFSKMHNVPTL